MHTKIIEVIRTEEDYREALRRFIEILDSPEGSPEALELIVLMKKLQEYELDNCV
jgi:antitoxin component HigA of HigAB toxin-antitoxin module